MNQCPVCFYSELPYPPADYHICPCCGTEFGNDDAEFSHDQLREAWVAGGAHWFFGRAPERWNPWLQLINGRHLKYARLIETKILTFTSGAVERLNFTQEPIEVQLRG